MKIIMKAICAALCLCLALSVSGCSLTSTAFGSAKGYNGDITLRAQREDDSFVLSIEKSKETAGIGSNALELFVEEVNARQSLSVDVISGATETSSAAMTAAEKALRKTGFDIEELKSRAETNNIVDKSVYCDVLVIGAGGAGLTAAITAAENGAKVVVVEKMGIAGGTTARSDGKIMAAGTAIQKYNVIDDSSSGLASFLYAYAGKQVDSARLLDMSAHTSSNLDMLTRYGVRFSNQILPTYEGQEPERVHLISDGNDVGGGYLIEPLVRAAKANGVEIYYGTEAYTLISTATNIVKGARARQVNGSTLSVYATATIIATGGYDRNEGLMHELASVDPSTVLSLTALGNTGDGINLAKEVDAIILEGAPIAKLYDYYADTNGNYKGILVNSRGNRFAAEDATAFDLSGALFATGYTKAFFITDARGYSSAFAKGVKNGDIIKAETIDELGKLIGAPALASTVTSYNVMCENGNDTLYGKPSKYLRSIEKGPFYAVPYTSVVYGTTGGIDTNISCAVLSDYGAIEGLYAAGEVVNGVYFDYRYPGFGVSLAEAVETGRIAGSRAAEFTNKLNESAAEQVLLAEEAPIERPFTYYPFKYYY